MVSKVLVSVLLAACAAVTAQEAAAQMAGQQPIGITVVEADDILSGWSVKRSILRKPVFIENFDKIGAIYDIVVAPDNRFRTPSSTHVNSLGYLIMMWKFPSINWISWMASLFCLGRPVTHSKQCPRFNTRTTCDA